MGDNTRIYTYLVNYSYRFRKSPKATSIISAQGSTFYYVVKKMSDCNLTEAKTTIGNILFSIKRTIRKEFNLPENEPVEVIPTDMKLIE